MRTVIELVSQLDRLRAKYADRDEGYKNNYYAYTGDYDRIFANYSSDALTISRGRTERTIQKWNLIRPIVDTHRLLVNQLPSIEVPPPLLGEELAAIKADKIEKILYALWDMGRMKRKHGEATFNLALNAATVWQIIWDETMDIPVVFVRSPGETYPVMKRGGEEVDYCFFRWEEEVDEVVQKWPKTAPLFTKSRMGGYSSSKVEVIEYVDSKERAFILGGDIKSLVTDEGGKHDLGHCPVIITGAFYIPGILFPPGIVNQLVPLNDHINRFQTKLGDAVEETLFGWHDIVGEGATNAVLNTGPGAVNRFETGLQHAYIQPQAPPAQAFGHMDVANRQMRNLGLWPEVASGETDASIITGKAVTRLQGIMAAQAAELQSNMGDGLEQANTLMLMMMEKFKPDKKFELYATEAVTLSSAPGRKRNFSVSAVPEEDFQGYYRNQLNYSPFGSDFNASLQIGMQLVDARIWPRSKLRNLIPGTSDSEGMAAEIREEDRDRAQFEADLQVQTQERILQAQTQQQQQLAAIQQQQQQPGGTGAEAPAGIPANAPQPQGGLPPAAATGPGGPGGEMIGGNTLLMPGGAPQMMGMGEPITGQEGFPIDYSPLKPYGPGTAELTGTGTPGTTPNTAAMPGKTMITADEIVSALESFVNRKGEKAIDKLQGSVYLMGDMATRGQTDGKIEIGITAKPDQQIITNALPQYASQGLLEFRILSMENPPNAVLIFGPDEEGGEETEQEETLAPQQAPAMPPGAGEMPVPPVV
jgi:hypothetical protein